MNKLFKVCALAVMMIIGSQAMAQRNSGALYLGASFPMKDFGKFESFNNFALTTENATLVGASIGFNVGIRWYFNVGVDGLNVMLSADGFYHGKNEALKTAYRENESSYSGHILTDSFIYKSKPDHFNVPFMFGLNYIYHFNPNFGLFVEAGAGCNMRFITDMETLLKDKVSVLGLEVERKTTTTQKYDMGFGFAYQVGIGLEAGRNFVVGCSFYDLGSAKVKGEQTIKTVVNNEAPTTTSDYKEYGTIHPMMIVARIGFKF